MKVSKITVVEGKVFLFSVNNCPDDYKDYFKEWVRAYLDREYSNSSLSLYLTKESSVTSVIAILNINENSLSEELDTTLQC